MSNIGIVGAGIAGVQLALYLQQNGIAVTIYSDKTPDAILNSRLPNTPARFPHTIERERQLNVAHWIQLNSNYAISKCISLANTHLLSVAISLSQVRLSIHGCTALHS